MLNLLFMSSLHIVFPFLPKDSVKNDLSENTFILSTLRAVALVTAV